VPWEEFWLFHDDARAHITIPVRTLLGNAFPTRFIAREGGNAFVHPPARSPDLTPVDFYLWGAVKQLVYRHGTRRYANHEDLREAIWDAFDAIRENEARYDTFARTVEEFARRLEECVHMNGGPVYLR